MIKKYLIAILILNFVPNFIFSMEVGSECKNETLKTFPFWQQLPEVQK